MSGSGWIRNAVELFPSEPAEAGDEAWWEASWFSCR
jgi:hypothetical protein